MRLLVAAYLNTSCDGDVSIFVQPADVTGPQPVLVVDRLLVGVGAAQVAHEDVAAPVQDLGGMRT